MSNSSHFLSKQNSQQPKQFRGGEKKVMKKSLSLLVAIAMVFSMFATIVSADGKAAGQKLQDLGVIKGTSDGLAEGDEWLRQDVTVLIARLLGAEETAKAHANTHGFTDLDSKFYNGFVSWAKENGYFNGESATKFGVGNPITNQQFAAVLLRVLKVDVEYAEAFEKAVELKLVSADLDKAANAVRGDIYEALVTALDYKIDGKKLGTILGLKGYEVTDLELESAGAVVAGSINLKFNDEVATLANADVTVSTIAGTSVLVEKVTVSGDAAVVSLAQALTDGAKYVVTVKNATSKDGSVLESATAEFEYKKAVPASIAFKNTTIAVNANLEVIVKDAAGNDISANYKTSDFTVASSAPGVVNTSLKGIAAGTSVVNVKITDTTITTENQIIYVKSALSANVDEVTLGVVGAAAVSNSVKNVDSTLKFTVKDHNGNKVVPTDVSVKSLNPTIATIDNNSVNTTAATTTGTTAIVKNLQVGSATILVEAKVDGIAVSKSFVITVRDAAAFSDIELNKTSVTLVKGSNLSESITLTVKDQYGEKFTPAATVPQVTVATANVIDAPAAMAAIAGGESTLTVVSGSINNVGSTKVTVKVTVGDKSVEKSLVVYVVNAAAENGYVVESTNGTTLDFDQHTDVAKQLGKKTTEVKIFKKDVNGNKIQDVTSLFGTQAVLELVNKNGVLTISNNNTLTANKAGTESVKVLVNNVHIATLTFTSDASSVNIIKEVAQNKTSVSIVVGGDLNAALTGDASGKGGAFVATNRYGDAVKITLPTTSVMTTDGTVVNTSLTAFKVGTVQLTLQINGTFYVINVNVTAN